MSDTVDQYRKTYDLNREHYGRDDLVGWLMLIREVRAELADFAKEIEQEVLAHAGEKRWVIPGAGEVTIRKKTKRTGWRHDELLPALIARVMDESETLYDRETGELLPYVQIGHNLTRRLRACVSFGAGKVTGLRDIGLTPDEFCTEEPDGWGVELPSRRE